MTGARSSSEFAHGETPSDEIAGSAALSRLADSSRVEPFSDGVLAIVVTLLVLDLKVPPGSYVGRGLAEQWPAYVAYLGSFAYAGGLHDSRHAQFFGVERRRAWAGLAAYATCAVVAFIVPVVALALALAVPFFYALTSEGVGRLSRVHGHRRT